MKITCLGSGAFSLGISSLLSENKDNMIYLWSHDEIWVKTSKKTKMMKINETKVPLKDNLVLTSELDEALKDTKMIMLLVSSDYIQEMTTKLKQYRVKNIPIFIGTKGLLDTKPYFFSQYLKKTLKTKKIAFFAGPNLALDLMQLSPCVIDIATKDKLTKKLSQEVFPDYIKLEFTKFSEVMELASILKNIYAMGAGMIYNHYPYSSTLLSFASECHLELAHILANQFDFEDLELYAGLTGDFFLANTMLESRNFTYGKKRAESKANASKYLKINTVEGYKNLESLIEYLGVSKYPILGAIYKIIYKNEKTDHLFEICFKRN